MADEQDIPVKVVDRRWWASETGRRHGPEASAVAQANLRRGAREADRRQGPAGPGVHRQVPTGDGRVRGSAPAAAPRDRQGRRAGAARCAVEILEVVDNLDRAVDAAGQASSVDAVVQGIEMVRRQFLSKLEGLGVTRVDATGQHFDPQTHEAVTTVPATSPDQDGIVVGIVRHGYRIGDDVLRPASVAVAKTAILNLEPAHLHVTERSSDPSSRRLRGLRPAVRGLRDRDRTPACPDCQSAKLAKLHSSPGMVGVGAAPRLSVSLDRRGGCGASACRAAPAA